MHTPGPWTTKRAKMPVDCEFDWCVTCNIGGEPHVIIEAFGRVSETIRPDAEANARLVAAAPDLLAALEWYVEHDDAGPDDDYYLAGLEQAKAALAKARGEVE